MAPCHCTTQLAHQLAWHRHCCPRQAMVTEMCNVLQEAKEAGLQPRHVTYAVAAQHAFCGKVTMDLRG